MKPVLCVLFSAAGLLCQGGQTTTEAKPPTPAPSGGEVAKGKPESLSPVKWNDNGWPDVPDGPSARGSSVRMTTPSGAEPAPMAETAARPAADSASRSEGSGAETPSGRPALASGMQFGSPLLDVFQRVRAPGAFKALGGRTLWWRITVYGMQGEIVGRRELTHVTDCAFSERDRLEFEDGRVYGRSGRAVFAEKGGMPWPTLAEEAGHELTLFGLHARMPWCFADSITYAVTGRDIVPRGGEALARAILERRPPPGLEAVGPEVDPAPRDHYEILYDPTSGQPREFVHRFANSLQTRRLMLEDWREVDGVQMPYRRIYVDAEDRQTTMLEILRVEPTRVTERTFRLH